MNGFMHFTKRERHAQQRQKEENKQPLKTLATHLAFIVPLILLFAYMGPFGTLEHMDTASRLFYWAGAILGGWILCYGSILILLAIVREKLWLQLLAIGAGAAIAAIPGAFLIDLLEKNLTDRKPLGLAYYYPDVLAVALVLSYFLTLTAERDRLKIHRREGAAHEGTTASPPSAKVPMSEKQQEAASPASQPCPFLRRLPAWIGDDLVHVSVEDHYVCAVTTAGREMILMRFRDALAELETLDGLQVHRSHWVAAAHVAAAQREGSKVVLHLDNGARIPVSRAYRTAIRQRGWL